MKGGAKEGESFYDWRSRSASNPNDPDNFDYDSIFNQIKFAKKKKKKPKVY